MIIESLKLSHFRLFQSFFLQPHPKLNILCGSNATGKTSVLEAINYLSSGKSFCSKDLRHLFHRLNHDKNDEATISTKLSVQALVRHKNDSATMPPQSFEISRQGTQNTYFIGGKKQKNVINHTQSLATLLITPENLLMVGGMPNLRRKRLNWGCFYLFPLYHQIFNHYQRALKQRNFLLKQNLNKEEIQRWDVILAREGRYISQCRKEYIEKLEPCFKNALSATVHHLDVEQITLSYKNGLHPRSSSLDLSEQFWLQMYRDNYAQDCRDKFTNLGPHRADLLIQFNQQPIEYHLSRGQWKILSSVLLISQAIMLKQELGVEPIILIDDFSSELDSQHRIQFMHYLEREIAGQTFISTVSEKLLQDYQNTSQAGFFQLTYPHSS